MLSRRKSTVYRSVFCNRGKNDMGGGDIFVSNAPSGFRKRIKQTHKKEEQEQLNAVKSLVGSRHRTNV